QMAHGAVDWQKAMDQVAGGNAADLARRVQVTPVLDNGRVAGLRVSTAGDAALMARLGLRPSDIVTAVNGIPVDSVARGQQILESLGSATEVRVTVTRDGMPAELALKLR
ncbi:MAG: PDZ domain-containing protein, partial [Xanthomonadales bacterium]|nr:PDZ domain-containing protein [Xanthomonadales bacterium]